MESSIISLSKYRFERAAEELETAGENLANNRIRASINRSYYSCFHAMRALTALSEFDSGKHSGIISFFNREFVKTGLIDKEASKIIDSLFRLREKADYDDFYVASREQAKNQLANAERFMELVRPYLESRWEESELGDELGDREAETP